MINQRYVSSTAFWAFSIIGAAALMLWPSPGQAEYTREPEVHVYSGSTQQSSFLALPKGFDGGVEVASGDINGDGTSEVILAPGTGGGPQIRIFDQQGVLMGQFFAYDKSLRTGLNVAVGDLDNDGQDEIVTVPKSGGSSQVRIFDAHGDAKFVPSFLAYGDTFEGGVNLAVGDLNGDGFGEIITAPESGGGPHVKVFDRYGNLLNTFFAFHEKFRGGVSIATADENGDGDDELIAAVSRYEAPVVKIYEMNGAQRIISTFHGLDKNFKGGAQVAGGDINGDGDDEILVAAHVGGGPQVRGFEPDGKLTTINGYVYEQDFRGGVNVATGDLDGDGKDEILTGPSSWGAEGRTDIEKYVEVDISQQRLFVYQEGRMIKSFLVSTGLPGYDTRPGSFRVSQKILKKDYSGPYYYFPNTMWNMRFDGSRLLHGAYWHNNFGRKKSHGCVNIPYSEARWLYSWADVGTTVIVKS